MKHNNPKEQWAEMSRRFFKTKEWERVRANVIVGLDNCCANCGTTTNLHCDHIIPRVKDRKGIRWLDVTNLQPLCEDCNLNKGTEVIDYRTPEQKRISEKLKVITEHELLTKGLSTSWDVKAAFKEMATTLTPEQKQQIKHERKKRRKDKRKEFRANKHARKLFEKLDAIDQHTTGT